MTDNRFIQFDKVNNFRDIGGLNTHDGRMMKSGILFRSGDLSRLSKNDSEKLRQLNVKLVCDLRTGRERTFRRDRMPHDGSLRIVNVPIHHRKGSAGQRMPGFLLKISRGFDFTGFIKNYYQMLAFERTEQVKEIISLISDKNNLPALIHCVAGKDRTGFVAALIQLVAGVPRATVLDDYLLTNRFYNPQINKFIRFTRWITLYRASSERMQQLIEVHAEYLDATLNEIYKRHETAEEYLVKACGISQNSLTSLKELVVE